ncbi:MAG: zinc/iron-chelating domain-containing protein [Myxococcales bacterium]|nr:zinc/iron-chelating domain-containing protein [Myxococcales bacterium]|tara:strand:+ start:425 stop:814 length:390 start_codon:yes stop_codon:yes gene_type:complete
MGFPVIQDGFAFGFQPEACSSCDGNCCRGKGGYVWLDDSTVEAMAAFLKLEIDEFAARYIRQVGRRFSLRENRLGPSDHACVFFDLDAQRCSVYPVRPNQCRTYPFWSQYKENSDDAFRECPGLVPLED